MSPDSRQGPGDYSRGPTTITDEPDRTAGSQRQGTTGARATDLRGHRARPWARRHLEVDHDDQAVTPAWPAPCAGHHPGGHDYWGSCSGANLTIRGRDAAGGVHPWRALR